MQARNQVVERCQKLLNEVQPNAPGRQNLLLYGGSSHEFTQGDLRRVKRSWG